MKNKNNFIGITYNGLCLSFYEWLNYYKSIDNFPLSLVLKLCNVYSLNISGCGNGEVCLIKERGV